MYKCMYECNRYSKINKKRSFSHQKQLKKKSSNFVFKVIATNLKCENDVLEENKYFI